MSRQPMLTATNHEGSVRLLFASYRPLFPVFYSGGAERSIHVLLHHLAEQGIQCRAIGRLTTDLGFPSSKSLSSFGYRGSIDDDGWKFAGPYTIELWKDFFLGLEKAFSEFRPTIICTQLNGALHILHTAHKRGLNGIWFVRDQHPLFHPEHQLRAVRDWGGHFACNSNFIKTWLSSLDVNDGEVFYPPVELDKYQVEWVPDGAVTFVNPAYEKGLATFIGIANRLVNVPFLLVEGWPLSEVHLQEIQRQLPAFPNVQFMRRVDDMREVYGKTAMLLVPSVWEEPFARVVLEAQASGIPVVASKRGGLPESVGAGGVLIERFDNVDDWVRIVGSLYGSPALSELSKAARNNARRKEFSIPDNVARFAQYLRRCQEQPVDTRSSLDIQSEPIVSKL